MSSHDYSGLADSVRHPCLGRRGGARGPARRLKWPYRRSGQSRGVPEGFGGSPLPNGTARAGVRRSGFQKARTRRLP
jgi:hypothetical protein